MTCLLDTNTCIKYLNGTSDLIHRQLCNLGERDVVLCSVVEAELFFGVLKSARPDENMMKLLQFTERFESFPFNHDAVEEYAQIRLALEKVGKPIGANDLMIAAIALCHGFTLVTHNTAEFRRVPNLRVVDWEAGEQ